MSKLMGHAMLTHGKQQLFFSQGSPSQCLIILLTVYEELGQRFIMLASDELLKDMIKVMQTIRYKSRHSNIRDLYNKPVWDSMSSTHRSVVNILYICSAAARSNRIYVWIQYITRCNLLSCILLIDPFTKKHVSRYNSTRRTPRCIEILKPL